MEAREGGGPRTLFFVRVHDFLILFTAPTLLGDRAAATRGDRLCRRRDSGARDDGRVRGLAHHHRLQRGARRWRRHAVRGIRGRELLLRHLSHQLRTHWHRRRHARWVREHRRRNRRHPLIDARSLGGHGGNGSSGFHLRCCSLCHHSLSGRRLGNVTNSRICFGQPHGVAQRVDIGDGAE